MIKIDDEWQIGADANQFIIWHRAKGKQQWKPKAFHRDLSDIWLWLARAQTRGVVKGHVPEEALDALNRIEALLRATSEEIKDAILADGGKTRIGGGSDGD